MIDSMYSVRLVPADEIWDKIRVELHAADGINGSDFLGVDPSVVDIATMENSRPFMNSQAAMAERAILLADNTREFYDSLADEAEQILTGPVDELLADEIEIAELLGYKKPNSPYAHEEAVDEENRRPLLVDVDAEACLLPYPGAYDSLIEFRRSYPKSVALLENTLKYPALDGQGIIIMNNLFAQAIRIGYEASLKAQELEEKGDK